MALLHIIYNKRTMQWCVKLGRITVFATDCYDMQKILSYSMKKIIIEKGKNIMLGLCRKVINTGIRVEIRPEELVPESVCIHLSKNDKAANFIININYSRSEGELLYLVNTIFEQFVKGCDINA